MEFEALVSVTEVDETAEPAVVTVIVGAVSNGSGFSTLVVGSQAGAFNWRPATELQPPSSELDSGLFEFVSGLLLLEELRDLRFSISTTKRKDCWAADLAERWIRVGVHVNFLFPFWLL